MTTPNRIYNQYRDKPKAVAWYNITPTVAENIHSVCDDIRVSYDIDTATGKNLDTLETIVVSNPSGLDQVPVEIDVDEVRRLLVKSKIAKNNSDASYDGIIESLQFITGDEEIEIVDNEDMTFIIYFGRALTPAQRYILDNFDVIPRPTGVDFLGYDDAIDSTQFGDDDSQFGDDDSQFGFLFGG